jgi:hypothetical protein
MPAGYAVPHLKSTEPSRFAPRQAHGEASVEHSPVTRASAPSRGTGTPRTGATSTPRSRFSGHSQSQPMSPTGGSVLFVNGMGSARRQRSLDGGSHMFRSTTTIGDAHIKDCSLRITPGPYTAARDTTNSGGTAAFRSKSPSDRDSHMRTLMHGSYGSPRSPVSRSSVGHQHMQPSASFRSASPNACAHITAQPKPLNASYELDRRDSSRLGSAAFRSSTSIADAHIKASTKPLDASYELDRRNGSRIGSAAFRSSTSIADAHIKASPRMHDVNVTLTPRGSSRGATSSFKSTTSIGDAHIKALPKPVDVLVAYRD